MNQFFYESRVQEKMKELQNEGIRSQAFNKSGAKKLALLPDTPKFAVVLLSILAILGLIR
jgi:hypothetical protein